MPDQPLSRSSASARKAAAQLVRTRPPVDDLTLARWHRERIMRRKKEVGMDSYSCSVRVKSVEGNEGGFGATAILGFEEGGGIDVSPGGPTGPQEITVQVQDAAEIVQQGALLTLTLARPTA